MLIQHIDRRTIKPIFFLILYIQVNMLQYVIIWIVATSIYSSTSSLTCSSTYFPYEYGGQSDYTIFYSFDIDSSYNVIAGGSSADQSLTAYGGTATPILVYFNSDSSVKWANQLSFVGDSSTAVISVMFSSTFICFALNGGSILIIVVDGASGQTVLNSFISMFVTEFSMTNQGMLYDATHFEYIFAGQIGTTWVLFKLDSTSALKWSFATLSTDFGYAYCIIFGETVYSTYVGGSIQYDLGDPVEYGSITRMVESASTINMAWTWLKSDGFYIKQLYLDSDTLFACAEQSGSPYQLQYIMLKIVNVGYLVTNEQIYQTNDASANFLCQGIYGDASNGKMYSFNYDQTSYNLRNIMVNNFQVVYYLYID